MTRRRLRPWTGKVTAYLSWSTGKGVDDQGRALELAKRAPVEKFLTGLPLDTERVVICGPLPGRTGPGLDKWVTGSLGEGWHHGEHYLDPDALAARYVRPDGRRVELHLLTSWARESSDRARPEDVAAAFALFKAGLSVTFGNTRRKPGEAPREAPELEPAILGSAASTGRELLLRSLPASHEYPVLDAEHRELIHRTNGQGRFELLTESGGPDELPGLFCYDMRWSYAALCRGVTGSGPAVLDQGSEFLGWAPARYEIEFTVPDGWSHLGLLPVRGEGWPNRPGSSWRTWVDSRELLFADRHDWPIANMKILQRLRFGTDREQSKPLRTWADKLMTLRQEWLPAQDAPPAVVALVEDFARSCLLAGLGALQGRRHKVTRTVPRDRPGEVPDGAEARLSGDLLVWTEEVEPRWLEMAHPEWVSQVWADQRCRLLDTGANAKQPNAGALHVPFGELVALRADAVWTTTDPGWIDLGGVGQFRPKVAVTGPVAAPRTVSELLSHGG